MGERRFPEVDTNRLLVSIGTGLGSNEEMVLSYDDMRVRGMKAVSPLGVQKFMPNGAAAAVGWNCTPKRA